MEATTGWEELGYLPRSLRESPQKSGSSREGLDACSLGPLLKGQRPLCIPQTGYTHRLATPRSPGQGSGTTSPAWHCPGSWVPAGQGWVPPTRLQLQKVKCHQPGNGAYAASLHLPSAGVWHARPSWDRDEGKALNRVTKEWRADDKGRAGRWRELPRAGRSPLK